MSPEDSILSSCSCQHVFHHICIKEWLLEQNTCPSCRKVYLVDGPYANTNIINRDSSAEETIDKATITKNNVLQDKDKTTFYCIRHGIVHPVPLHQAAEQNIGSATNPIYNISTKLSSLLSFGSTDISNIMYISSPTLYELAQLRFQPQLEQTSSNELTVSSNSNSEII
jgi:RING-H2 zinc finger domain